MRRYLLKPPQLRATVDGEVVDGVTTVVQNADPYTFFGTRPIRVCEGAEVDSGSIGVAVLQRATVLELPTLIPRLLTGNAARVARHRRVRTFPGTAEAIIESRDGRPLPVQVDGDYIGEFERVRFASAPGALTVVS